MVADVRAVLLENGVDQQTADNYVQKHRDKLNALYHETFKDLLRMTKDAA